MKTTSLAILFLFVLFSSAKFLNAQTIEERMTKSHATCQSVSMNALDVLPALYKQHAIDSMQKALEIWETSCYGMPEVKITRLLMDMETSTFSVAHDVDANTIDMLNNYAAGFPSEHTMQNVDAYQEPQTLFYRFAYAWSKLLLQRKNLDENEKFICGVLKGEIKNPGKEIRQHTESYAGFVPFEEKSFENHRKLTSLNLAVGTGVWLPTNNLATLGIHPSFTFQFGIKDMKNQLDISVQIRYLHSANPYVVGKDSRYDTTKYYVGYYLGGEYTRYLLTNKRFDFGVEVGAGWDAFDFKEDPYYYYDPYYNYSSHYTIGSFNANAGLRANYYFTRSCYVGLLGRYNGINYSTYGGTNLSGDAFTIDLIFGFNVKEYR